MSETKHTPGPWRAEERSGDFHIVGRPTWPCLRALIEKEAENGR